MKAPCPPFPAGSWFVCLGDSCGTLLEVLPWGHVQDKEAGTKSIDAFMRNRTSTHILLQTPLCVDQIEAVSAEQGWECARTGAGLFDLTKIWVEGRFLIELMTPAQARSYLEIFGSGGLPTLEATMRDMELALQKK
jgi:hypothetical protein